eukprot:366157-Hanusia_phi.AAC.2
MGSWIEFHENVQFFLPGALGWELPRSGVVSEYDLYQVLELRQFEYLESLQLFDKGDIDEYELEELFSPDDEEVEVITDDASLVESEKPLQRRSRCLPGAGNDPGATSIHHKQSIANNMPGGCKGCEISSSCRHDKVQGRLLLLPPSRRETSHKALKLASRTAHNIFKKKLMEVVEVLGRSNQSGDLPPVLAKSYQDNWKKIVNSMSWCWPWCSGDPWSKMLKDKNSRSYGTAGGGEGEDSGEKKFICHERISLIVPVRGIPGSGFQFVNRLNLTLENVSQVTRSAPSLPL